MIQAAESDEEGINQAPQKKQKTVTGALCSIWKKEGPLGFYKGLQAQILKTVLSSALLLMIKEKITKTSWVLLLALRKFLFITRTRLKIAWSQAEVYLGGRGRPVSILSGRKMNVVAEGDLFSSIKYDFKDIVPGHIGSKYDPTIKSIC